MLEPPKLACQNKIIIDENGIETDNNIRLEKGDECLDADFSPTELHCNRSKYIRTENVAII